jgi:bacterioferritin-associated ferredoxin
MYVCPIPNGFRDRAISLHCTVEQHATPSRELQSALMLKAKFTELYYTR